MKQTQQYNNIPARAIPKWPKGKEYDHIEYVLCGVPEAEDGERQWHSDGFFKKPSANLVPKTDRVFINWRDENRDYQEGFFDIAAIKSVTGTGTNERIVFHEIWFLAQNASRIVLNRKNLTHREWFEYLELTNYNESNPNRDPAVKPIFRQVKPWETAKLKVQDFQTELAALNLINDMSEAELREEYASRGGTYDMNPDIIRTKLAGMARRNPAEFLSQSGNADKKYKSVIKQCQDRKLIKFDGRSKKWAWTDNKETLFHVAREADSVESFAAWLKSNEQGQRVFPEMMRLLDKAIKAESQDQVEA